VSGFGRRGSLAPRLPGPDMGSTEIFPGGDMAFKRVLTLIAHAFIGWLLCAATMGIGMAATTLQTALIVHAVGAPIFFAAVSTVYFTRFRLTSPLLTAIVFVLFVIVVDFFVVALLINRSLEMFASILGTWIPFALIFGSTLLTGTVIARQRRFRAA